jgi:hypothetical protein
MSQLWTLQIEREGVDRIQLAQDRGSFERDTEPSDTTKCEEICDRFSDYQLLNKDSTSRS